MFKNLLKNAFKVFVNYLISLILFAVFIYPVLSIAKNNLGFWIPVYSFIIFLLAAFIIYQDMNKLAYKEKNPFYNLEPHPLKGLFAGIVGFSPLFIAGIIKELIVTDDKLVKNLLHIGYNVLLGPVYFIVKIFNESAFGYIFSVVVLIIFAASGYITGFYGIKMPKIIKTPPKPANLNRRRKGKDKFYFEPVIQKPKRRPVKKSETGSSGTMKKVAESSGSGENEKQADSALSDTDK